MRRQIGFEIRDMWYNLGEYLGFQGITSEHCESVVGSDAGPVCQFCGILKIQTTAGYLLQLVLSGDKRWETTVRGSKSDCEGNRKVSSAPSLISGEHSSALECLLLGVTTVSSIFHESNHVAHPTGMHAITYCIQFHIIYLQRGLFASSKLGSVFRWW